MKAGCAPLPPPTADVPTAERTLPSLLQRQAARYGDKPLIRFGTTLISYAGARDSAAAYAGALATAGVEPGDRIALVCPNRLEVLHLWLGASWGGHVLVPINTASRGPQLEHVLGNSEPRILAVHHELLHHLDYLERLPSSLEQVWTIGGEHDGPDRWRDLPVEPFPNPGAQLPAHGVRAGDTALILYTGGTTGPSKGVCCPHAQSFFWGLVAGHYLGVTEDSTLFTTLPLFHTNALNTFSQALVAGATFAFGERFSASRMWRQAREAGATHAYLLGAMVHMLLQQPASPDDRVHGVSTVLAPATSGELIEAFSKRYGVAVVDGYGSTESNMTICSRVGAYKPGAMGGVVPGFTAAIVDGNDIPVPAGTSGELVLRHDEPYSFATGYFGMPEVTARAWRNLWFHTGDRVVQDEDGVFWFIDRIKDAIRRRGENISSFEVEQVLLGHPGVSAAAVVPVPSDLGEDEVMAFLVAHADYRLDPADLIRYCEPRLAYFAIPRYLEFVDALPLTEVGRVRKYVLRERGVTETTWDREAAGITLRR